MNVAVIIPAHNEEKVILGTLAALEATGFNKRDIYVVDDASTDATHQLVESSKINLLSLKSNVGKANALRRLIRYFLLCERYDWVVFLDADTEVDAEFLPALTRAASDDPEVALFVGQVVAKRGSYITALRAVEYAIGQDLFKSGMSNHGLIFVAPGCASMYRSKVLRKLRFEGDTLAEDMDLTMQVQRRRKKIVYLPEAVVYTQDPGTALDYAKQVTRWYRGTWQVLRKYRLISLDKKQKVDFWILFLMTDALLFNRIMWILAGSAFLPMNKMLGLISLDVTFYFLFACYAALKTRRLDVIYKFPIYFWASYINPVMFFKTFWEVMVFKKQLLSWNQVQRY